jgi:hypothetical protein
MIGFAKRTPEEFDVARRATRSIGCRTLHVENATPQRKSIQDRQCRVACRTVVRSCWHDSHNPFRRLCAVRHIPDTQFGPECHIRQNREPGPWIKRLTQVRRGWKRLGGRVTMHDRPKAPSSLLDRIHRIYDLSRIHCEPRRGAIDVLTGVKPHGQPGVAAIDRGQQSAPLVWERPSHVLHDCREHCLIDFQAVCYHVGRLWTVISARSRRQPTIQSRQRPIRCRFSHQ